MTESTANQTKPEKGFATGEHVVLRPVMETDLPELARLMAENPFDETPTPWTHQRLKKKFEDKDDPGLWGKSTRYFAVVRKEGGVVGFLKEGMDENRGMFWNIFHLGDRLEDRDVLGRDTLKAYMDFKLKWHAPLRIGFDIIEPEENKAAWLVGQGFECELKLERRVFYQGEPVSQCLYSWFSDELLNAPVDPHKVAGEE